MVDIMLPLITCIFVVFDLASGGVAACANHKWKSSEMRKGLYHKFGSIMLVVLAYLIDYAQKYRLGLSGAYCRRRVRLHYSDGAWFHRGKHRQN